MTELFSVWQFFENDTSERVRQHVSAEEAVDAFKHYSTSVGAQFGMTVRVIVVDMGDSIVAEWQHGKGITFPTAAEGCTVEGAAPHGRL